MPNKRNYQKELELIINENVRTNKIPSLVLHCCCAPCSSYCLEYISEFFDITVLYYNPNIAPLSEYSLRVAELKRLLREMPLKRKVKFIEGKYETNVFYENVKGLENETEGGLRCEKCFEIRLREAAKLAMLYKFDFFTTTLTISPLKSANKLNKIGEKVAKEYGVSYLNSDFKKRGGYQRSLELSKEYNLYRQNYCGCKFSRKQLENKA